MKRVSKGFLLVAGVYSAIQYAISTILTFIFSYVMLGSGLGLFISGLTNYNNTINNVPGYSDSAISGFQSMMIAGGSILVSMIIFSAIMMVVNAFLLLATLWSLLNMAVLPDKKVPHIISVVIGALTLGSNFLVGLLMILGGIFGMIALKKEKKAALEAQEAK